METKNNVLEFSSCKAFITYELKGDDFGDDIIKYRRAIYDFTTNEDLFDDLKVLFNNEKLQYFSFTIL